MGEERLMSPAERDAWSERDRMEAKWLSELAIIGERGERNREDLTAIKRDVHEIKGQLETLSRTVSEAQTTWRVSGFFITKLAAAAAAFGGVASAAVAHWWKGGS